MRTVILLALCLLFLLGCATTQVSEQTVEETSDSEPCKKYYDFGFEYLKNGSYDDAIVNFQKAVDCSTAYVEAWIALAQSYSHKSDFQGAESVLTKALQDAPEEPMLYCAFGRLCIDTEEFDRAAGFYLKALSGDSLDFTAVFGIAYVYELMDETTKAIYYYNRAKTLEPEDTACRFRLAEVLTRVGRYEEGLAELKYVVDMQPEDIESRMKFAETYMDAKRYSEALAQFQAVLEREPDNVKALLGVGRANVKLKKYSRATDAFEKARELAPESPAPLYYLIDMYLIRRSFSNARRFLDEALAMPIDDKLPFYVQYGDLHFKMERYERAIQMYERAKDHPTYGPYAKNQINRAKARIEKIKLEEEGF